MQIFDLKRPLEIPYQNFDKALRVLQHEEHAEVERNHWKESLWGEREKLGREIWEEASQKYFRLDTASAQKSCIGSEAACS